MERELQVTLMHQVMAHIDAGTTDLAESVFKHPVSSYTDPARLASEQSHLFGQEPLLIAMSCQIPNVGDYMTDDRSGIPIVIVRGEDGAVRAFRNACQHRGARVAEGAGCAKALTCRYHGWTYALDGRLKGIPDKRSFTGVDPDEHGLQPLPVAERNGMVWARSTPSADGSTVLDMTAHLGKLDAELNAYGLAGYHHYETRIIERKMNWKLVIDTFLEPYHLGVLHRDTVAPLFIHNLCLFEPLGKHLREVLPRQSISAQRGLPEQELDLIAHNTIVYIVFPNTAVIVQVDHVETWRVFPVAGKVDECVMELAFFVPNPIDSDSARRHWERNMDLTIRTVCDEDFPTAEGMQRNFALGTPMHAIIGRNEPALAHFERTVTQRLLAATTAP